MIREVRLTCLVAFVAALMTSSVLAAPAPAPPADPQQVDQAIKRAKDYLYSKQANGNWEASQTKLVPGKDEKAPAESSTQWGGLTAIATYALLAAGESPQDPRLKSAIDWLKKADIGGTYAVGVRCQVWLLIPQTPDVKEMIVTDFKYLQEAMRKKGPSRGFYHYVLKGTTMDHSASQYGVLGAWACERAGLEVPTAYWRMVESAWRETQQKDGGWTYSMTAKEPKTTPSMTAAGIATLFITQDYLKADAGIRCVGNIRDTGLEKGLAWITENFSKVGSNAYTLYGIERIGVASGYKYFGTIDWFDEGAKSFLKAQSKEGSWNNHGTIPGTAFGILFLVRGRAPVVMNKLIYEKPNPDKPAERIEAPWNQRPRDAANVTKWIAKQIERDLNFQVVNLKVDVSDLHDSQILYMSGNDTIVLAPEDEAKLKEFVEQGGLILGHADCGAEKFSTSFMKLGTKLFPSYEFAELANDHPIYNNQQFMRSKWKNKFEVKSLSNGVRELMMLIPSADPGKSWQMNDDKVKEEFFQFAANLFLYSVDKQNLRYKGETYLEQVNPKIKTDKTLKLARLEYAGNWNPEPGGWRRLANIMHNDMRVKLEVEPVKLGEGKLGSSYKVAHLTGTTKLTLTPAQRDELKKWIDAGGKLIVDSAGGNLEFATSAEDQLGQLFPGKSDELKQTVAQEHAMFGAGDRKITEFEYRAWARRTLGSIRRPQIRAIMVKDAPAVVFSREDLSAGLVGQPVDGIAGYSPSTASQLMSNVLVHLGGVTVSAPAKPATKATTKPAESKDN